MEAILLLEDGTIYKGKARGKCEDSIGEVVFNTSMTGYQEILTDPSYAGQIVTMTFPLIGNYGINEFDNESSKSYVKGFIAREICDYPNNFRCSMTLDNYLKENDICALEGIDTRALTMHIREQGCMNGAILVGEVDEKRINDTLKTIKEYKIINPVYEVTIKDQKLYESDEHKYKVVLYDFGYKRNILMSLKKRGCDVLVVPAEATSEEILKFNPDGIMLSNGPGDPKDCIEIIENIKNIIKLNIPVFGICLGHQLVALAMGGNTEKLKYGHRGTNHPVKDIKKDRVYITAQNHGYAVVYDSIKKDVGEISHININDGTVEGVRYHDYPVFTVQFHPEASAGTMDTAYLFDSFIELIKEHRREGKNA